MDRPMLGAVVLVIAVIGWLWLGLTFADHVLGPAILEAQAWLAEVQAK